MVIGNLPSQNHLCKKVVFNNPEKSNGFEPLLKLDKEAISVRDKITSCSKKEQWKLSIISLLISLSFRNPARWWSLSELSLQVSYSSGRGNPARVRVPHRVSIRSRAGGDSGKLNS
ncbi:hypothetical protein Ahy_B05g075105 isoform A [Arachis hypogaea]|uniref:Uncharacterized protein n=1 Tax=Arachis hypogaea TaxID=3818 RepID=A0A444Z0G7_ARAHY|nr:hypothetical protein Ahy_B05g075105 isoform A [Arachis hypogaea]